jgi:regulatory protein SWI5
MPTPTQMQDLGMSFDPYMSPMNLMMKKSQSGYDTAPGPDFELFTPDSALSTPTFMTFAEASPAGSHQGWISEGEATNSHSRRTSRRISNGILDRVSKFENMGQGSDSTATDRPMTPSGQNDNSESPRTPFMSARKHFMVETNQADSVLPPYTNGDTS